MDSERVVCEQHFRKSDLEALMKTIGAKGVGRFAVEFEVANHIDIIDAQRGLLEAHKVRRLKLSGVVDPGATGLVLPEKVVLQLGLPVIRKVKVRYANNSTARRDTVTGAYVRLQGRDGVFTAVVEPKRRTALIGAIVLEDLDFLVDCGHQRLVPRDPRYIVSEMEQSSNCAVCEQHYSGNMRGGCRVTGAKAMAPWSSLHLPNPARAARAPGARRACAGRAAPPELPPCPLDLRAGRE
jgi:predicted aspartyl protease